MSTTNLSKFAENFKSLFNESLFKTKNKKQLSEIGKLLDYGLISQLLPYESYDATSQIFYNKQSQGFILEAIPFLGCDESTINILSSLVTDMLPEEADLQWILSASPKIGNLLDKFEETRSYNESLSWLSARRNSFLKNGVYNSIGVEPFILRNYRLFWVISIPAKPGQDHANQLIKLREDISSSLKSIYMPTWNINVESFMNLLHEWLHPDSSIYPVSRHWNPHESLSLQIPDPHFALRVNTQDLLFNSSDETIEARCFTVKDFPREMSQWNMGEALGQMFNSSLQIPCPFVISFSMRKQNTDQVNLKVQYKYMDKEKSANSPLAKFLPLIQKQHQDWAYVRQRLAENDRLVKVCYQVFLFSKQEDANASEQRLINLYRANGWRIRRDRFLHLPSYLALLPMMMSEGLYEDLNNLGRLKTITAFNAVNLAPLQGDWRGSKTPSLMLPSRRGQVTFWNPFDNQDGNYNVAIAAAPGRGKSVFTQEYILSMLGLNGRIWVIDAGRSYEKTCKLLKGTFLEFKKDTQICLNPFTNVIDFEESINLIKPLFSAMARPTQPASDEEANYIEKAIKAAWIEEGNEATVSTVANWLEKQKSDICKNISHLLYSYTKEGMHGKFFEGRCSIDLSNPFVVLELQELKDRKNLQNIILLLLMYQINSCMYTGSRKQFKSCIIDEAWDLLGGDNDGAASFIEAGYRTARKYKANFVTITQSVNDYYKNAASTSALENSDYHALLGHKPETIEQLKIRGRYPLDPYTEKLLLSLKKTDEYSECLIKSPNGASVHRILLDPMTRILFSSKADEFEAVQMLTDSGLTLEEAINQVARRVYGNHI